MTETLSDACLTLSYDVTNLSFTFNLYTCVYHFIRSSTVAHFFKRVCSWASNCVLFVPWRLAHDCASTLTSSLILHWIMYPTPIINVQRYTAIHSHHDVYPWLSRIQWQMLPRTCTQFFGGSCRYSRDAEERRDINYD